MRRARESAQARRFGGFFAEPRTVSFGGNFVAFGTLMYSSSRGSVLFCFFTCWCARFVAGLEVRNPVGSASPVDGIQIKHSMFLTVLLQYASGWYSFDRSRSQQPLRTPAQAAFNVISREVFIGFSQ